MQLTTERLGQPPARPSVVIPTGAYVYDIAHRSGLCIGTIKVDDVSAVSAFENCPVATGAAVISAAGGDIVGYDMYGQLLKETLTLGVAGTAAFARVTSGPADVLFVNTFGLPYKWASGGTGDGGTYAGPADPGDPRGTFTPVAVTEPADIQLHYTVDQTDTYGNIAERYATPDRIDPVTTTATIDANGLVSIVTALIADSSTVQHYLMPDGVTISVANEVGAPTYQLGDLYIQQYGQSLNQLPAEDIISGVSGNGTVINVTTTAQLGGIGGGINFPEPDITGPYMTGGTQYWVNKATCKIGFDVDSDPAADVWYTMQEIDDNDDISQESKDAYRASLAAVGCSI